jgi:hypothetical protein
LSRHPADALATTRRARCFHQMKQDALAAQDLQAACRLGDPAACRELQG